jgi:hypothetical protein
LTLLIVFISVKDAQITLSRIMTVMGRSNNLARTLMNYFNISMDIAVLMQTYLTFNAEIKRFNIIYLLLLYNNVYIWYIIHNTVLRALLSLNKRFTSSYDILFDSINSLLLKGYLPIYTSSWLHCFHCYFTKIIVRIKIPHILI